ncbi:unnamed protein product [Pylaiella littoralis]
MIVFISSFFFNSGAKRIRKAHSDLPREDVLAHDVIGRINPASSEPTTICPRLATSGQPLAGESDERNPALSLEVVCREIVATTRRPNIRHVQIVPRYGTL